MRDNACPQCGPRSAVSKGSLVERRRPPRRAAISSAARRLKHRRWRPAFTSYRRRSAISRDITIRALETLAAADVVLCEDTRTSARLLDHYGIKTPREALHEHNERERIEPLLADLARGAAHRADLGRRHAAALRSGLSSGARRPRRRRTDFRRPRRLGAAGGARHRRPADRQLFLPRFSAGQGCRAAKGPGRARESPETLAFYESPRRLAATLAALAEAFWRRPRSSGGAGADQALRAPVARQSRRNWRRNTRDRKPRARP